MRVVGSHPPASPGLPRSGETGSQYPRFGWDLQALAITGSLPSQG